MTETETMAPKKEPIQNQLWFRVMAGLVLGGLVGVLLGPDLGIVDHGFATKIGEWLALPGRLFLTLLKFIVLPLVISSVMLGICDGNDLRALRTLGWGLVYFVATTTIAILIGFALTSIIQPGSQIDQGALGSITAPTITAIDMGDRSIPQAIISAIPTNLVEHMVRTDMLQVVIAALIFGLALLKMPNDEGRPIVDLMRATQQVCMTIVMWLMKYAPIVVFGLIANTVITMGFGAIGAVSMFFVTVIIGLFLVFLVYMVLIATLGGRNPVNYVRDCRDVILLAFSTSSSSATMPVTLRTVEEVHKVRPTVSRLVIPLGTTINMAGTAIYQGIAAVFIAQAYGIDLTGFQYASIVLLAVAGSIGTPGIPSASIPILAAILQNENIPVDGIALILGVDRLLDMSRTIINVTGDMTAAAVLDRLMGHKLDDAGASEPIV